MIQQQSEVTSLCRRSREIIFQQLDDELLAVDAESGYCYALNETAGQVWEILEVPMSLQAICAQIRQEYKIDEETCLQEVNTLLEGLRDSGLVEKG